jgi:uncharacterized protein (TIGR02147 family)
MTASVYSFRNYLTYLRAALPTRGEGRGQRAKLAEALGCGSGFVSLVLGGRAHFSPEHAMRVSDFLEHDPGERDFFLSLVLHARAGSKNLEDYYSARIDEVLARRREIREHIQVRQTLSEADRVTYYSSWHVTAVHMCLFVPELRSTAAISKYLALAPKRVSEIIEFLVKAGFAERENETLRAKPSRTHLPADSPLIAKHHTNWRMKAIQALDQPTATDLHYSAVMCMSEESAEKMRSVFLQALKSNEAILKATEDRAVYAVTLDLFPVARSANL